jgi:hypothetical protein
MKKTFIIAGIIFSFLFALSIVYACEPCPSTLNFEETVEKSDLIIIGQRTDFSPNEQYSFKTLPESINVKIIEILKGNTNQNQITVNSWDGMCGYGIVVDDKEYVMLLQEKDNMYDAVDFGCSIKTFSVENGLVDFNGDKISIDEFTSKIGSQADRKIIDDKSKKQISVFYYVIPAIVILIVLFFIILKMRKK